MNDRIKSRVKNITASFLKKSCTCGLSPRKSLSDLKIVGDKYSKFIYAIHKEFNIPISSIPTPWKTLEDVIFYVQSKNPSL